MTTRHDAKKLRATNFSNINEKAYAWHKPPKNWTHIDKTSRITTTHASKNLQWANT